ncbi:ATP-binding protein [Clostridium sp.]|uniref:sensor histidine kinase n=1 Tax=Clostridium sp. TaxID=1506 RepID=UPI003F3857C0
MKRFFDELIENIIILNREKKVISINKELKEKMGYKNRDNLSLEELNRLIKIKDEFALILCKGNDLIKAKYKISILGLSYDEYYVIKVNWEGDKISKLINIEKLVDSLESCAFIKNINNKYLYINQTCANKYNLSKDEVRTIMNNEVTECIYNGLISKNDDYIKKSKNSCINEAVVNTNGIEESYEIRNFPILDDLGEVEFIATILKNVTFTKGVQLQTFKCLNILENQKEDGREIDDYKDNLFNGLKSIFQFYFKTDLFNIWEYDKKEKSILPYFLNKNIKNIFNERKAVNISDEKVNNYLTGNFKEIEYINVNEILNVEGNLDVKNFYLVKKPIICDDEFIGFLSISYESYPIARVLNNDLIKYVCDQVGFIIKYIRFLKRLNVEKREKENIRQELEEFIRVATDIIVKIDEEGNFLSVSSGVIDVLGWSKEEILKMKWMDIVHPDDLDASFNSIDVFRDNDERRLIFINRFRCADGSYKWIQWGKGFYKHADGYFLGSGRDITREKELEIKEGLVEKSIELERVRTEFFANLSHELKTPLTLIMAVVQVVEDYVNEFEDENKKDNFERYLNVLKQNSYRLLRLVTNLIDVTRIDAGFYHLNPQNNNIVEVVEDIVMSVVTYCEGKNINLTFNTETEEEIISCDAEQIERVILNILSNAIKFTNSDGDIYVDISLEEENVIIKIEDSGIGIPKENLEFIFERFTQIDNLMTRKCEGSGIGLSLVKSIVELHNGSVQVESVEGLGTTFIVTLPRKRVFVDEEYIDNKIDDVDGKLERCSIEFSDIYDL